MHRDSAGWGERLKMEDEAYWRFEQHQTKRQLATCGAGLLGAGTMGTGKTLGNFHPVEALHKTSSMPVLGPHPPCGRRVGDDLGMSECGSEPRESPLRRKPRLQGHLESRLNFLERTFSSSQAALGSPQASHMAVQGSVAQSRLSTARSLPRATPSVRSIASRGSMPASVAGSMPASVASQGGVASMRGSLRSGHSMRSNMSTVLSVAGEDYY